MTAARWDNSLMGSSPLLFFAFAVLGTLIGLTIPVQDFILSIFLCIAFVSFFVRLTRLVKALFVSATVITALAMLSSAQGAGFRQCRCQT